VARKSHKVIRHYINTYMNTETLCSTTTTFSSLDENRLQVTTSENTQNTYLLEILMESTGVIRHKDVELTEKIGGGTFGKVYKGNYVMGITLNSRLLFGHGHRS
jgi:hypothetical protein